MIRLNKTQIETLAKWASAHLQQMYDNDTFDGDVWIVYNGDMSDLNGKIDVNIYNWEDDEGMPIVRACAYKIVDGSTDCGNWVVLF